MSNVRVLVLDDHEVVRRGICDILDRADGIEVVAEAGTVAQAVRRADAVRPDVVLSDLRLPDGTGLEVIAHVRRTLPDAHIIVLTSYDDDEARSAARAAGADMFLAKTAGSAEVVEAVRLLKSGNADGAIGRLIAAIEQEPSAERAGVLGFIFFRQQRWDEAADAYRRARQIDPRQPAFTINLAQAMTLAGKSADALELVEAARRDAPRAARLYRRQ